MAKKKSSRRAKDERIKNLSAEERQFLKEFGNIMKSEREIQDLTLYGIEDRGYPSWQHWQKLESGLRDLKITTILKICKALRKQPRDIFSQIKVKI